MVTAKLLELFSTNCGDWAGYWPATEQYYCGWMSPHNDIGTGVTNKNRDFTIAIEYSEEDGRLVHRKDGKLVLNKLCKGDIFTFDAANLHSFLPLELAELCVAQQSHTPARKLMFPNRHKSTKDNQVRLVWKFL